jgi:hypothetical protein
LQTQTRIRSGSSDEFVTRHLDLTTSTSSFSYCSRFGFRYELWSSPVPDAADPPASSPSSHDRVQASQSPDLRRYIARLGFHASDSLSGRGWHCALKSARRCVRARVVVSVLLNPPTRRRTHRNCAATPKHFETTCSGATPGCGLSPFLCGVWKKLPSSALQASRKSVFLWLTYVCHLFVFIFPIFYCFEGFQYARPYQHRFGARTGARINSQSARSRLRSRTSGRSCCYWYSSYMFLLEDA